MTSPSALEHPFLLVILTSDVVSLIIALCWTVCCEIREENSPLRAMRWWEREGHPHSRVVQGCHRVSLSLLCLFVQPFYSWEALPLQSTWIRKVSSNSHYYVPSTSGYPPMFRTYYGGWKFMPDSFLPSGGPLSGNLSLILIWLVSRHPESTICDMSECHLQKLSECFP